MRETCIRCTRPVATEVDEAAWQEAERSDDPPDPDEGWGMCWGARGDCEPGGPQVRVTNGRLVLHDDDYVVLHAPVDEVIGVLVAAGLVVRAEVAP